MVATTGLGGSILGEQEMAGKLQMFPGPEVFPAPTLSGTSGMSKLLLGPDTIIPVQQLASELSQPALTGPPFPWALVSSRGKRFTSKLPAGQKKP